MFSLFLFRKSLELLRLIDMKVKSITNQAAKCVLSIECASILCGTDLDHQQAVKLSGLKPAEYKRQKDLTEKLLNLNKTLTLDEICAQLEISDRMKNDARILFNEYKAKGSFFDESNSTPILAMAIYQSVKQRKDKQVSATKASLLQFSKMKSKAWKQMEDEWDNWIEKCKPLEKAAAADSHKLQTDNNGSKGKLNKMQIPISNFQLSAFIFIFSW